MATRLKDRVLGFTSTPYGIRNLVKKAGNDIERRRPAQRQNQGGGRGNDHGWENTLSRSTPRSRPTRK